MTTQNKIPFFAELGLLLNRVRSISSAINKEVLENLIAEDEFSNVRYMKNTPASRLQERLQQLEDEMAYFFTENGTRKATDNLFDAQTIQQRLTSSFKALCNEYFTIKSGPKDIIDFQQNGHRNEDASIYKLTRPATAVVI